MDEQVVPVVRPHSARGAGARYARLGVTTAWEHRSEPALPPFSSSSRGPVQILLSGHEGHARPAMLVHLCAATEGRSSP